MQKDKAQRVKQLVLLVWAIMFFGRSHHHTKPPKLRFSGSVRLPKTTLEFPECKSFTTEIHVRSCRSIGPPTTMVSFSNTTRGEERPHEDIQDALVGSANVRSNIVSRSQCEVFLVTEFRRPASSTTLTPTRTIVASNTTTLTAISSSSASLPPSEKIPALRTTPPPRSIGSSPTAAASTNINAAIPAPIDQLYLSHPWAIYQGNPVENGEISQTISISSDEQDDSSLEDQSTNADCDRPRRHVVTTYNGIWSQENGPTLAVGYLGGPANDIPLNGRDGFPLATNSSPVIMNGIGSNHRGAPTTEASDIDPTHDGTQTGHHHVEVPSPREIYDRQRAWEWPENSPYSPLRPEERAQHLSDVARQVASIDNMLYGSIDEHTEGGCEGETDT